MNTDDEIVLRAIFAEHDPAASPQERRATALSTADYLGREQNVLAGAPPVRPAGSGPTVAHRPARRRGRWWIPAVAAAVVAAAAITPAIWSSSRPAAPTAVPPAAGGQQTPPGPVARAQYDHVRWQSYTGTNLDYTVDWWFNGVAGRELKTAASGTVTEDLTLSYVSTRSSPVSASATANLSTSASGTASAVASPAPAPATRHDPRQAPSSPTGTGMAQASPAPTAGVEPVGDDFPGKVPTTVADLQSYLADPDGTVSAQKVESIIFQRMLDTAQTTALAQIARSLPATVAPRTATTPTGIPVQLITPTDPATAGGPGDSLVLSADGARIIGVSGTDGNGGTWWQLVELSEHTTNTSH